MALRQFTRTFAGGVVSQGMARLNARYPRSHNDHFHPWILANLPQQRRAALDVGCGRGGLLAALSPYFESVHGNDVDDEMRRAAAARCAGLPNVTIHDGRWADLSGPFDPVTMVAVLHHLDEVQALRDVRELLAPGGRFLAVGLAPPRSAVDYAWDLASIVTNPMIGFVKHPWPSPSGPQSPVPIAEAKTSYDDLQQLLKEVMPGAVMRHHLAFRHTIAWTKPR